ncbi:MAG: dTDP-4-dehydrorhamnose reductase [Bacteroidales bacterium]|nr:dTDP-4-dehydrorhamnose reductase [Bacteroidales bacterium]
MKILVTGANGQLGRSLREIAGHAGNDGSVMPGTDRASWLFTDVEELDITNLEAVRAMVASEKVEAIVNCAAYTNVEAAEDNEPLAELLNAKAVENLAVAMKEVGGLLVHISTDYVFGGEPYNTPCKENQKGTPTGAYGRTKLHGEEAILRSGVRHVIIRTAWLYSEYGNNFVKTMLRLTSEKPSLKVVIDQVGTPTYAHDLAEAIVCILQTPDQVGGDVMPGTDRASHIFHFSNEGVCSWFDFAKAIAAYSGQTACDVLPCRSEEFPSKVHRPAYSVLDKTKIKETFGLSIPYWTDSLKKCLKNLSEPLC